MHHGTWGIMQRQFTGLIEVPTHHIIMSWPLGATNCSCQQFKVHKFSSIIEGSTAQLVKHKALNLVDMGSSPMMGVTSHNVILHEAYIKSQLNIILLSRPLGATHCCSSLHDHIYKVPAPYCIITRHLGATSDMNIMEFYIFKLAENQMSISRPIFFTIFFCEKPMPANWLWSWYIDPDFPQEGNTKELRMIRCRFTRAFNPEHNLSKLFLCLFYRISLTWMNPN